MDDFNAPATFTEHPINASIVNPTGNESTTSATTTSANVGHSGDRDNAPITDASFFANRVYRSKEDVIAAVVEYNHVVRRAYRVVTSDKRRYQAKCATAADGSSGSDGDGSQCAFVVRFAFSTKFKPPTRFHPHTCSIDSRSHSHSNISSGTGSATASMLLSAGASGATGSGRHDGLDGHAHSIYGEAERAANTTMAAIAAATTNSTGLGADPSAAVRDATNSSSTTSTTSSSLITNRACRAKQITRYPEVRALVTAHGAGVKAAWIKDVLVAHGLQPTYANCFHARKRLLTEFAADPVKFAENSSLVSLATFATASPAVTATAPGPVYHGNGSGLGSGGGTTAIGYAASSGEERKRAAPVSSGRSTDTIATGGGATSATVVPSKKPKHDTTPAAPPSQHQPAAIPTASTTAPTLTPTPTPTPTAEPQGCCFICPSVRVPSSTAAAAEKHQILQWQVRDQASVKTFFDLYDDNRRIEILKSGTYRLHLYFEAQSGYAVAAGAKYYLMVNNKPLGVFKDESSSVGESEGSNGDNDATTTAARDDVPLGVFNVAQVQLNKWDMIVLRRTRGEFSSGVEVVMENVSGEDEQTPFGRFIIELVE